MSSTTGAIERPVFAHDERTKRQFIIAVAYTALALLLALATILLLRRLSGGFPYPLGPVAIISAAVFLECAALWIRRLYRNPVLCDSVFSVHYLVLSTQYAVPGTIRAGLLSSMPVHVRLSPVDAVTTAAVIAVAIALSIGGTSSGGLIIAWLIIAGGEIGQRLLQVSSRQQSFPPQQPVPNQIPPACEAVDEITEPEIPPGLVQQVTRVVEDGRESIHVLVRADVAPNDRLAIIHIAFCPPLCERPELAANALDCQDVEIRLPQVESYGARLEVRWPGTSDQSRNLIVEILGSAKASRCS
jgi:hypothetical protein